MGDYEDISKELGASEETAKAIETAAGTISKIWPMGNAVISFFGPKKPDALMDKLNEIDAKLNEISKKLDNILIEIKANAELTIEHNRRLFIKDELLKEPSNAWDQLLHYDDSGINPDEKVGKEHLLLLSNSGMDALGDYNDTSNWGKLYIDQLALHFGRIIWVPNPSQDPGHDLWDLVLDNRRADPPSVHGNIQWDYEYILPAYLKAIAIRLTILQAIVKNYRNSASYRDEILRYIKNLSDIYNIICYGIVIETCIPYNDTDNLHLYFPNYLILCASRYHNEGILKYLQSHWAFWDTPFNVEPYFYCAVGEKYSGIKIELEAVMPLLHYYNDMPDFANMPEFTEWRNEVSNHNFTTDISHLESIKYRLLNKIIHCINDKRMYETYCLYYAFIQERLKWEIYKVIGLPALRNMINDLKRIASDNDFIPDYTTWSVREGLNIYWQNQTHKPENPSVVSLRDFVVDACYLLKLDTKPSMSLRNAFMLDVDLGLSAA